MRTYEDIKKVKTVPEWYFLRVLRASVVSFRTQLHIRRASALTSDFRPPASGGIRLRSALISDLRTLTSDPEAAPLYELL